MMRFLISPAVFKSNANEQSIRSFSKIKEIDANVCSNEFIYVKERIFELSK